MSVRLFGVMESISLYTPTIRRNIHSTFRSPVNPSCLISIFLWALIFELSLIKILNFSRLQQRAELHQNSSSIIYKYFRNTLWCFNRSMYPTSTWFWWGNLRERDYWGDPGIDGRIILRRIFRKWDVAVWTGSSWLRIGTGGGHLWMR